MSVLALARNLSLGIDTEWIRHIPTAGPERYLAPQERSLIVEGQGVSVERFLRLWTRKEAWSKVDGRGIDRSWPTTVVTATWPQEHAPAKMVADPNLAICSLPPLWGCEVALAFSIAENRVERIVCHSVEPAVG